MQQARDEDLLAAIGRHRGAVLSGGRINLQKAAEVLIYEFRQGVLGRMTLETPADLRLTEAAKTLASVLAREGLQLAWEPRLLSGKANPTGTDLMIYEPVITWQKDR